MRELYRRAAMIIIAGCSIAPASAAADLNDYPTAARAEYVFACMQTNGQNQQSLNQCSCSIDVVASIIPYSKYVSAETVLSVSQTAGPVGSQFRVTEASKIAVRDLRRAQAEAEVRCF